MYKIEDIILKCRQNEFTAEEYEKHPGNIEILFSIDIIKKYNKNLVIIAKCCGK